MNTGRAWHGESNLQSLLPVRERISFVYVERSRVHRDRNAVTCQDESGTTYIPVSTISTLLLGPGCTITHQAIALLADSGVTTVWVGEGASRYYAHGRSLATSTRLLQRQAELVSAPRKRLALARQMYAMRFPDEDVSSLTMQQLRGREGARVRATYRRLSRETGVPWKGRQYDRQAWAAADSVNQALSSANAVLYGAIHAVVVALGCSPGLGVIHTGHEKAFVHDIADLYKAHTSIPCAFQTVAAGEHDLSRRTRRNMRDHIHEHHVLAQAVHDIKTLLGELDADADVAQIAELWDPDLGTVAGGMNHQEAE